MTALKRTVTLPLPIRQSLEFYFTFFVKHEVRIVYWIFQRQAQKTRLTFQNAWKQCACRLELGESRACYFEMF